jgi:hypothetical protein
MSKRKMVFILCLILLFALAGCGKKEQQEQGEGHTSQAAPETVTLKIYPMDSMAGVISQSDDQLALTIDPEISADGNGSLRIEAADSATVRLYEAGDLDVEDARLIYRAKLRTENVSEKVYLEMWCHFPEAGDFFSRGLDAALSGSNDWVTVEALFFLKAGENPDQVKLNLVIEGSGTVWIDDVRLIRGPLQ